MMQINKKYLYSGAAALCLVLTGTALLTGGDEPEETRAPRPVKLLEMTASTDIRKVSLPAIIEASDSVELSFQVPGLLKNVAVEEGDTVRKGQIIATLDRRDFQNSLATAQAEFEAAQAEYERGTSLAEADAIADSVLDQRKARRDIARANLSIASKALNDSVIRAPFNGVVAVVQADNFQSIGAQVPVITLQGTGDIEAVVEIPSTIIANAERIELLENTIVLDVAPDQPLQARISETARRADPRTQTFEYRFSFSPPEDVLVLPGMTATVLGNFRVIGDDGKDQRLAIPTGAIVAADGKTFVWIVDPETMAASKREVTTSTGFADRLHLDSGVQPGELIVAAGAAFLHDGMTVRRLEQQGG